MEIPKLDQRNKEDFIQQIQQLAKSYLPQWQFNSHNPDMGSVAALIFAGMMQDVVERYNRTAEKNMVEFFRHLGASPLQLEPARSYVQCSVSGMPENVPGEFLPEGVQVLAQTSAASERGKTWYSAPSSLCMLSTAACAMFSMRTQKRTGSLIAMRGRKIARGSASVSLKSRGLIYSLMSFPSGRESVWICAPGSTFALSFEFEDTEPELIQAFPGDVQRRRRSGYIQHRNRLSSGTVPGKYRAAPWC